MWRKGNAEETKGKERLRMGGMTVAMRCDAMCWLTAATPGNVGVIRGLGLYDRFDCVAFGMRFAESDLPRNRTGRRCTSRLSIEGCPFSWWWWGSRLLEKRAVKCVRYVST